MDVGLSLGVRAEAFGGVVGQDDGARREDGV